MRSFRRAEPLILALCLSACASRPDPAAPGAPALLAASLCTLPEPAPSRPPEAGLVRPATARERAATAAFLGWAAAVLDHDADLSRRLAAVARSPACGGAPALSDPR